MTRLHLVRHGETVWHGENRYAGSSDVDLTDTGRRQAQVLARWAGDGGTIDRVVSSPLSRARLTATPAAAALGLPVEIDERVRESHFGRGEGLTREKMRAAFPEALDSFLAHPATRPLPDGETGAAVAARALAAFTDLRDSARADSVLVVFHTTALRLALSAMLGMPLDDYRRRFPRVSNVAITTVELPPTGSLVGTAALLAFNATPADG